MSYSKCIIKLPIRYFKNDSVKLNCNLLYVTSQHSILEHNFFITMLTVKLYINDIIFT